MRTVRGFLVAAVAAGLVGVAALGDHAVAQTKTPPAKDKGKAAEKPPAPPAAVSQTFEVYKDKGGKFRFRLVAGETQLAMSHIGYATKADAEKVIDQIKKGAGTAKVEESTDK